MHLILIVTRQHIIRICAQSKIVCLSFNYKVKTADAEAGINVKDYWLIKKLLSSNGQVLGLHGFVAK